MYKFASKLIAPLVILSFLFVGTAHADRIDRLVKQLKTSDDYKVRLSAATSLSKLRDKRSVSALVYALRKDENKNVRAVAATSLGKVVTSKTSKVMRIGATKALERAAKRDKVASVRRQAKQALKVLAKKSGGSGGSGIYVNVGTMTVKDGSGDKMRKLMRKTVSKTIKKKADTMTTEWPGGKAPTAKQLRAKKARGFHVDGTLVSLETESKGAMTLVSCKISMLIATYPKKSMFGFLDGGAKVQAGSSDRDVQYAQEDCVAAVVEDLVARKIIPTIQSRKKP